MRSGRIALIVFLLLVLVTISVVMGLQLFRVREVVVEGCDQRDPLAVAELAGVDYEESIFKLRFREIRQRIDASPYFEVEQIGLLLPDRLRIQVHERAERAVIEFAGSFVVLDEEGFIVERRDVLGDTTVPVVTGMLVTNYSVGEQIESEDPKQLSALQIILAELIEQDASHLISEINVSEVSDLSMVTTNGIRVKLGNFEDMDEKIRWLRATLPVLLSEGHEGGTLNLSTGKNASFLAEAQPIELPENTGEPETTEPPDDEETPEDGGTDEPATTDEPDEPAPETTPEPEGEEP